ncbi:MAG: Maf family nucleotide pyrophosphatase [Proteobacteria bacterium]|nr:Maf family nucleotide pyrophosphatase [Pseudomonadota bacterium]
MGSYSTPIIVLASTSIYRQELLKRICKNFQVVSPKVDETPLPNEDARLCAERLSIAKARAVAHLTGRDLIIGSDQVAECDGRRLSKPGSLDKAIEQLKFASGRTAFFYTGICVLNRHTNKYQSLVVDTEVTFRQLSLSEIQRYVETEDVLGCAGSAKSEGLGITLLESILGSDPTALVGLPLIALSRMLRDEGVTLP